MYNKLKGYSMKIHTYILLLISLCFFCCKEETETHSSVKKTDVTVHNNPEELKSNGIVERTSPTNQKTNQMNRDQKIVGTWRHTEVISSGTGESYVSMTTDDFIEFRNNGTVATWVGNAVAGNFESKADGNVEEGLWNTNETHTQIIFTDPVTKQQARVNYYVENPYLMFSNGNSKKVYEKIN